MASDYLEQVKRVYGRRTGRPLSPSRQSAFEALYEPLSIPLDILTEKDDLDPLALFTVTPAKAGAFKTAGKDSGLRRNDGKVIFEIGFGSGEHILSLMEKEPGAHVIGAEPFLNGMTALLKDIQEQEIKTDNLRLLMDDALYIARSLKDESVDDIYILNPDPWHKSRHHKRRIVRQDTLDHYVRLLKPGGKLIMTTDVAPLAEWMVAETIRHGKLRWTARSKADWESPPPGWSPTRYEGKRAKGASKMVYLIFEKP